MINGKEGDTTIGGSSMNINDKSDFIKLLGNSPKIKILYFLLKTKEFDYAIASIAEGAGVNRITAKEIIDEFIKDGLVDETRKLGKSQLYKIKINEPKVKSLVNFYNDIIKDNLDFISKSEGLTP